MTEADLIARVLAGDRLAGRELYDAHASRVFRLAYRMTHDEEIARECTQDTFVRAFSRLRSFRRDAALATWIHRIAISVVLQEMRSRRRHSARFVAIEEVHDVAAAEKPADVELSARLARAVDDLPEIYRTAFIMHDLEGYTHSAIADVLEIPEGTCKTRVAQARARLRETLEVLRDQ